MSKLFIWFFPKILRSPNFCWKNVVAKLLPFKFKHLNVTSWMLIFLYQLWLGAVFLPVEHRSCFIRNLFQTVGNLNIFSFYISVPYWSVFLLFLPSNCYISHKGYTCYHLHYFEWWAYFLIVCLCIFGRGGGGLTRVKNAAEFTICFTHSKPLKVQ